MGTDPPGDICFFNTPWMHSKKMQHPEKKLFLILSSRYILRRIQAHAKRIFLVEHLCGNVH